MIRTVLLAILALSATLAAQDADRARTEALAARATERLRVLQQEADRLASQARTLLGDLRKLEIERQIREEEFRRADSQAASAAAELQALDKEVRDIIAQEDKERPDIQSRMVELYKLGGARYLRMILSLSDIRNVGQATRMVAVVARQDQDRIAAYQRRREQLAEARTRLEERTKELATLRTAAARARAAADRAIAERNVLIADTDKRRDLNAQLAGELQAAGQGLQGRLRDLAAGVEGGDPIKLPLKPFQGELDWPVNGSVRERFGQTASGDRASSNGIEIAAAEGAPVKAIHDGTVAFADAFTGFGKLVILDHGAQNYSVYGNLLEISVTSGARVDAGETVGSVGPSVIGTSGLHFELRIDGAAVDPLQWLRKR